jgi:hypothetical protein
MCIYNIVMEEEKLGMLTSGKSVMRLLVVSMAVFSILLSHDPG